jgi:hypothetical protein
MIISNIDIWRMYKFIKPIENQIPTFKNEYGLTQIFLNNFKCATSTAPFELDETTLKNDFPNMLILIYYLLYSQIYLIHNDKSTSLQQHSLTCEQYQQIMTNINNAKKQPRMKYTNRR